MQEKIVLDIVKEYIQSGMDEYTKKRYNSAVSLFFKAISGLCDILIYRKFGIFPDNHTERFRFLERLEKDLYENVRKLFKTYRFSYARLMTEKDARRVKNGLKKVIEICGGCEELKGYLKEK